MRFYDSRSLRLELAAVKFSESKRRYLLFCSPFTYMPLRRGVLDTTLCDKVCRLLNWNILTFNI